MNILKEPQSIHFSPAVIKITRAPYSYLSQRIMLDACKNLRPCVVYCKSWHKRFYKFLHKTNNIAAVTRQKRFSRAHIRAIVSLGRLQGLERAALDLATFCLAFFTCQDGSYIKPSLVSSFVCFRLLYAIAGFKWATWEHDGARLSAEVHTLLRLFIYTSEYEMLPWN